MMYIMFFKAPLILSYKQIKVSSDGQMDGWQCVTTDSDKSENKYLCQMHISHANPRGNPHMLIHSSTIP